MAVLVANTALAIPFLAVFIAGPLWMTVKHPETGADHTEANRYLRARAEQARPALAKVELTRAADAEVA